MVRRTREYVQKAVTNPPGHWASMNVFIAEIQE
jgi:hypothetical protein